MGPFRAGFPVIGDELVVRMNTRELVGLDK